MPDAISHQRSVLTDVAADLAGDLPRTLDVALGLVLQDVVHFVTAPPPTSAWGPIVQAISTRQVVVGPEQIVVPLVVDDEASGVLVAPGDSDEAPLALLRLLGRHLAAEGESARLRNRLETMLRDYVSSGIADTLLENEAAGALGGEQRQISVLFADMRGFTSFTERTAWEVVVSHLNQVFGPAISIVEDHGGTVANLMGDAIMATFGAVSNQPDHPYLAAKAALALCEAFAGTDPHLPRLGVGVNSGPAVVGNIGGRRRRVFTAIGDTVNLAARLEGTAKPGQVIIGTGTYRAISPLARAESLEPFLVKGKEAPVQAYLLHALADATLRPDKTTINLQRPAHPPDR